MSLSREVETAASSGIGIIGVVLGNAVGLIEFGGDVLVAFLLGASGAAGGYVVKEVITYIQSKIKR